MAFQASVLFLIEFEKSVSSDKDVMALNNVINVQRFWRHLMTNVERT